MKIRAILLVSILLWSFTSNSQIAPKMNVLQIPGNGQFWRRNQNNFDPDCAEIRPVYHSSTYTWFGCGLHVLQTNFRKRQPRFSVYHFSTYHYVYSSGSLLLSNLGRKILFGGRLKFVVRHSKIEIRP